MNIQHGLENYVTASKIIVFVKEISVIRETQMFEYTRCSCYSYLKYVYRMSHLPMHLIRFTSELPVSYVV